mmetsp:Transcript_54657/g.129790  ORF Transcript_54657/g.129790 Transcript_54657/m.129790 type:complete len:204 (+) Transcript_54657:131-742(+)
MARWARPSSSTSSGRMSSVSRRSSTAMTSGAPVSRTVPRCRRTSRATTTFSPSRARTSSTRSTGVISRRARTWLRPTLSRAPPSPRRTIRWSTSCTRSTTSPRSSPRWPPSRWRARPGCGASARVPSGRPTALSPSLPRSRTRRTATSRSRNLSPPTASRCWRSWRGGATSSSSRPFSTPSTPRRRFSPSTCSSRTTASRCPS